jgi:hypothetical protein
MACATRAGEKLPANQPLFPAATTTVTPASIAVNTE